MAVAVEKSVGESRRLMYLISSSSGSDSAEKMFILIRKIRELKNLGADLNYVNEDDGTTILSHAIEKGLSHALTVIAQLGCDLDQFIHGQHPLLFAIKKNKKFMLPLFELGSGGKLTEMEKMIMINNVRHDEEDSDCVTALAGAFFNTGNPVHLREHNLFSFEELRKESAQEKNEARKHYLKLLGEKGPYRTYCETPNPSAIDPLYEKFPNFHSVLDHIKRQVMLANLSPNAIMTISPILLHGAPGIGKTRFVNELAKVLGAELSKINCGSVTAGWIISGSSTSWQEGRPGMVHTSLRDGATGNPIIMLDEVDKLSGDSRFNAFGSLYELLEDSTSNAFTDEAVGIPMDCSRVSWIATANDISVIPGAILSRMKLIEVEAPNLDQIHDTINSIMADILLDNKDSWGSRFEAKMPNEVISILSANSPRDIRNMIRDAMGEAAVSRMPDAQTGRFTLHAEDFVSARPRKQRIGF